MTSQTDFSRVVIVSGYFNAIHAGHIEYMKAAKEFAGENGLVYCIVNSDYQSILKKKFSFVPENDRLAVMSAIKYVDKAFLSIDKDRTVNKTIQMICDTEEAKPTHCLNDGDVTENNKSPEEEVCKKNGIEMVYAGNDKIQSSSWILEASVKKAYEVMYPSKPQRRSVSFDFNVRAPATISA
jgi:D-beta-D-heptose 7-phosphate kinase/D-beta-D-heptose 1-phosphate adenosyltransferase